MSWRRSATLLALTTSVVGTAAAQEDPRVATLARLLAAEDRRVYVPAEFEAGMRSPDPVVRRQATLGAGRIQDHRAGESLLALLESADTTGHADAMFALGLLGDSTLASAIITRLGDPRPLADRAVIEAPAALAKLGTGAARTLFSRLLDGTSRAIAPPRVWLMLPGLLVEGWRFGRHAPVRAALEHLRDTSDAVRWRAAYLLGRTRASVGTRALLGIVGDPNPWVRQYALRGLTRVAADSAGVPRDSVLGALRAALADADAGVRVNALVSLATWADSASAPAVVALLRDRVPNVRLQSVTTLNSLGGSTAVAAVRGLASDGREPVAIRREALLGVSRSDGAWVRSTAAGLAESPDPRLRELAIELAVLTRPRDTLVFDRSGEAAAFASLIHDPDPAVKASAIGSLGALSVALDSEILVEARSLLDDPNDRVRSAAWSNYARVATGAQSVPVYVERLGRELARGRRGVTGPLLSALRRIYQAGGDGRRAVETQFLATTTPPADYLLRRQAANWPALAERWGPVFPAEVRYTDQQYRELATTWLLNPRGSRPRVRLVTEGRGTVEVELLGDQAPLTVANFLGLVDAGAFDGGEWHRVIPNFVVQDGAGPREQPIAGLAPIRDEFNPVRYDEPVLGMALSGPDTGTSQWFINLSPQPHLDGGYTVFGRVIGDRRGLEAILQGDRIRSITRR